MAEKIICRGDECLYDPRTGLVVTPAAGAELKTVASPAVGAGASVGAVLGGAAAALGSANIWVAAAQGVVQLAIVAVPAIRKMLDGEPVSVEEQGAVDAFMRSVEDGRFVDRPEWKQD